MIPDSKLKPAHLVDKIDRLFQLSAGKILRIQKNWDTQKGGPVFTIRGKYTSRAWTEWTHGFQYGSALLQFDATGDEQFLELGRRGTIAHMAKHVSHTGVHDHGFNVVSTYGNLLRFIVEGKIGEDEQERHHYELGLKVSGAVQAARWTAIAGGKGYIYSFNGPHSLFADTIRTLRVLAIAHRLGHVLKGESDRAISLLRRLVDHIETTVTFNVYHGKGRDSYDVAGRVAHEAIFNINDGQFRCPNSQQGYSGFTTWTRGLAWIMCGLAEQLEFFERLKSREFKTLREKRRIVNLMTDAAQATCDYYLSNTPIDGIPYWDTGAPNLHRLGDYLNEPADPFNDYEPVDSSAAAIAAQGLLRLGRYLQQNKQVSRGKKYYQAGLTIASTLFDKPYLSDKRSHHGLLLHSIYHRPNGWDHVPRGAKIPRGESSMWGDYHARELALLILRQARGERYLAFGNCVAE